MDPGALVYSPSRTDIVRAKAVNIIIGLVLVLVGVTAAWVGLGAGLSASDSNGGDTMVLVAYVLVGVVILGFGLRYLSMGLKARGLRLYERAIEADFPGRWFVWPERRREALVRVRVEGTPKLTSAYAISASGHEFRLPRDFVDRSNLWRLGALGTRPLAPGGRPRPTGAKGTKAQSEEDLLLDLETGATATVVHPVGGPEPTGAPAPSRAPSASRPSPAASRRPLSWPRRPTAPPPTAPPPPAPPTEAALEVEVVEAPPPAPTAPSAPIAAAAPAPSAGEWELEEVAPPAPPPEPPQPPPPLPSASPPSGSVIPPRPPRPSGPRTETGQGWEEVESPPM